MAEEWGTVIFKVSSDLLNKIESNSDSLESAAFLAQAGGIPAEKTQSMRLVFEDVAARGGYGVISYHCEDWRAFSELVMAEGSGLEVYARTNDEYGTAAFFSVNAAGEKCHFWFDQGGDLCDVEGYEDKVMAEIEQWKATLPDDINKVVPDFADTDDLMFDRP